MSRLALLAQKQDPPRLKCNLCGRLGHEARSCNNRSRYIHPYSNPDRDIICSYCKIKGHRMDNCHKKMEGDRKRREPHPRGLLGGSSSTNPPNRQNGNQVGFINEDPTSDTELLHIVQAESEVDPEGVYGIKRGRDGEPLPKQTDLGDTSTGAALLHPLGYRPSGLHNMPPIGPNPLSQPTGVSIPIAPTRRRRRRSNRGRRGGRNLAQELERRSDAYDVIQELSSMNINLTVGQLLRGDALRARSQLRSLFRGRRAQGARRAVNTLQVNALQETLDAGAPRKHQTAQAEIFGLKIHVLLDSGAIPNIMSKTLADRLNVEVVESSRKLTVANGEGARSVGIVENLPVTFDSAPVAISFLALEATPFDLLLGMPTLVALQARMDLAAQVVTLNISGKKVILPLEYGRAHAGSASDCSEEFTSCTDDSETDEDESSTSTVGCIVEGNNCCYKCRGSTHHNLLCDSNTDEDSPTLIGLGDSDEGSFTEHSVESGDDAQGGFLLLRSRDRSEMARIPLGSIIAGESLSEAEEKGSEGGSSSSDEPLEKFPIAYGPDGAPSLRRNVFSCGPGDPYDDKYIVKEISYDSDLDEDEVGEYWKIGEIEDRIDEDDIWEDYEPTREELQTLSAMGKIDPEADPAINIADIGDQETALVVKEKDDIDDLIIMDDDPKMHEEHVKSIKHLDKGARRALEGIFKKYDIIAWPLHDLRPSNAPATYHFELSNYTPAQLRPPKMVKEHKEEIRAQLREKLDAGVISPSRSPWAFPLVTDTKPDGAQRLCVNFRP
eukprot:Plantae.Rhodophyta-Hildenbrandia_rubra.ctg3341.p1 GENE.Plantae.Rhodophyta-Hildenbrandia_rubra.ctg3341~~Plantae.Rhodophyta-Hildenbrandia_rubra.ctg3341.p1  ORF type:complete len:780 (+),score=121.43 Plantae.Rhodophyta-Hildenbrandia_rubra.ctg3341:795-3134(+)